jgi:preprotein translocase subunit YajC
MDMIISDAFAQTAAAAGQPGLLESLFPIIFIVIVFYFLLIRPQQKRYKQHREMVESVQRGDQVVTGGGIIGTVKKVESDDVLLVDIADSVTVQIAKATIANVIPKDADTKDTPAKKSGKTKSQSSNTKVANDN